jgi:hypothetical protein
LFSATYFLEFLFYFQKTTKTVTNVEELHEPHDVVGQETNMSKSHRKFNVKLYVYVEVERCKKSSFKLKIAITYFRLGNI